MNEKDLVRQRFRELSQRAYSKGYSVFTQFLNLDEISILKEQCYDAPYTLLGGYDGAERCIACFGEETAPPISCIEISPKQKKFSESLTHRDYLGAIMNLGIERSVIGDIVILDGIAYVFCLSSISDYICDSLDRIRHTSVCCKKINEPPEIISRKPDIEYKNVSSLRVDAVISSIYNLSRATASQLIRQEKVFINSRAITKDGTILKEADAVSVRGYGKFIFNEITKTTRKERLVISVGIYK